jgi:hypothetical protein
MLEKTILKLIFLSSSYGYRLLILPCIKMKTTPSLMARMNLEPGMQIPRNREHDTISKVGGT